MHIHKQENILWEEWAETYPAQEQENFVMDGLCNNGSLCNNGWNALPGNEEEL